MDYKYTASIIVLAYSDKKYLTACLESLLDQDMPPESYEIIYADNASTDESLPFVKEHFPRVKTIALEKNYGFAEGNNRAATHAQGRYIAFQNADTVAQRSWLSELVRAIESDPEVKAAHPTGVPLNFGGFNERNILPEHGVMCELTRFGYVDFYENDLRGGYVPTLFIAGGSLLVDREIHPELKYYFDPSYFIYNEDTDLGLRINNLGYSVLYVPTSVSYHQRDPSRRTILNRKGIRNAYLVTRNRFITFYKNMNTAEYLLALPLICMGSIIKLRTMPLSLGKRIVYSIGLIPYTIFALLEAVTRFPTYAMNRKSILSSRRHEKFWLLQELWERKVPARSPLVDGLPEQSLISKDQYEEEKIRA
jgi:GT2 family glycosyltransferase